MKLKHLLFLLVITCGVIIGPNVYAANVSGYNTYYIQQTSNGTLPDNYSSNVSGLSFPTTTYTQLGAYQNQTYNVIRAMDLQFPNIEFVNGNTYTFTINFDYGSYIYPSWPNTANISTAFGIRSCPHGTCTATMTWQNDSTHQSVNTLQLKLVHKANANQTGKTFGIGVMTGNNGLFYNAYSSQQGIRINSATVDIVEDPNYQNTQDIINNNNQNTQTIINNQNENTEKEIESQKVCSDININYPNTTTTSSLPELTNGFLASDGAIISNIYWRVSDFIPVNKDKVYSLSTYTNYTNQHYCLYNNDKTLISCSPLSTNTRAISLSIVPSQDGYIRFSIVIGATTSFSGTSCKNGNQALNDTLTDDTLPDVINSGGGGGTYFDDINSSSDTPISDLLLLPINLLTHFEESLSNSCSAYTIPFDFTGGNNTLTFPCINIENYLGSNLWGIIDGLFSIFMLYNIFMLCVTVYDHITSLDDLFPMFYSSDYYSGRHEPGQYAPRHGGD